MTLLISAETLGVANDVPNVEPQSFFKTYPSAKISMVERVSKLDKSSSSFAALFQAPTFITSG